MFLPPSVCMCVYVSTPLSYFLQVYLSSHNILLRLCSDTESLYSESQRGWVPLSPTVPDMTIKTSVSRNLLFSKLAQLGSSWGSQHPSSDRPRQDTSQRQGRIPWFVFVLFLPSTIPSVHFLPFHSLYHFTELYFGIPQDPAPSLSAGGMLCERFAPRPLLRTPQEEPKKLNWEIKGILKDSGECYPSSVGGKLQTLLKRKSPNNGLPSRSLTTDLTPFFKL